MTFRIMSHSAMIDVNPRGRPFFCLWGNWVNYWKSISHRKKVHSHGPQKCVKLLAPGGLLKVFPFFFSIFSSPCKLNLIRRTKTRQSNQFLEEIHLNLLRTHWSGGKGATTSCSRPGIIYTCCQYDSLRVGSVG